MLAKARRYQSVHRLVPTLLHARYSGRTLKSNGIHTPPLGRHRVTYMNIPLGYALLRDKRVATRAKLIALGIGVAATGLVELLQLPFESVFALLVPLAGAAGDIVFDGAEAVILPVLVATVVMPYLASPSLVEQIRVERARPVPTMPSALFRA
jgi:hypothetical protein